MADYKPQDCECKYPAVTLRTGSGHAHTCPAHLRWEANGRSWRGKQPEDFTRHTTAAGEIVTQLADFTEQMNHHERDFVEGLAARFDQYGDRTFISDPQMAWLRRLEEKYR